MIKSLVLAAVTAAGALGATSANAGISWSVNVNTPFVGTVISGAPGYYDPGYYDAGSYDPGYGRMYAPAAVYGPAPVYRVRPTVAYYPPAPYYPPVAYYPPAVVYRPVPVAYPRYYPGWRHGHDHRWDSDGGR